MAAKKVVASNLVASLNRFIKKCSLCIKRSRLTTILFVWFSNDLFLLFEIETPFKFRTDLTIRITNVFGTQAPTVVYNLDPTVFIMDAIIRKCAFYHETLLRATLGVDGTSPNCDAPT